MIERGQIIHGAAEVITYVRSQGIETRFLTNITGQTPARIAINRSMLGIAVDAAEVQTATTVCVDMLKARPDVRCHLLVPASVMPTFEGIAQDDTNPDVIVVSEIGEEFTYARALAGLALFSRFIRTPRRKQTAADVRIRRPQADPQNARRL